MESQLRLPNLEMFSLTERSVLSFAEGSARSDSTTGGYPAWIRQRRRLTYNEFRAREIV